METLRINNKEVWIDVMRAFACICVLLVHSPVEYINNIPGQYILAPANYVLMAWGVSLFFMISGALLFSKPQNLSSFYKRRFSRILIPILVWSIIYIFFDRIFEEDSRSVFRMILMIPVTQQTGLLWFMYTLVGIYLITPIISYWLSVCEKRDVEIVLGLWGITLFIPYLKLFDSDFSNMVGVNGVLHSFYGFVGYALLGYYLRKYVNVKLLSWEYIIMVIVAFGIPFIIFYSKIFSMDVLNSSMSLSSALMSIMAFLFFKGLDYKDGILLRIIMKVAEFSFGIYLSHMLFLKPLKYWLGQLHINYVIQIPLTALFVGGISYLFVWGLSKLPKSKWLFG